MIKFRSNSSWSALLKFVFGRKRIDYKEKHRNYFSILKRTVYKKSCDRQVCFYVSSGKGRTRLRPDLGNQLFKNVSSSDTCERH